MSRRGKPRRRRGRGRSGQLTYWAQPEPEPQTESAPRHGREPLHGYTVAEIHQAARLAANSARGWLAADYLDQYEAAWFGICEYLLLADEPPQHYELIRAGQQAVNGHVYGEMHHAGFYKYKNNGAQHGPGSMPAFIKFWNNPWHAPSPEEHVTDRQALTQIWECLTEGHRQVLAARAIYEDYADAAVACGLAYASYKSQLFKARRRFLALWHEGETPSRLWRIDKRTIRRDNLTAEEAEAREAYRLRRRAERGSVA